MTETLPTIKPTRVLSDDMDAGASRQSTPGREAPDAAQPLPSGRASGASPPSLRRRGRHPILAIRAPLPRTVSALLPAGVFVLLAGIWILVSRSGLVSDLFLPSPLEVVRTAWRLVTAEGFLWDLGISIYRVLVGYLAAVLLAVPIGLMMGSMQVFRSALEPGLAFARYMPATAFIPLLVLWLGIGDVQKFSVIFVGTFFTLTLMVMVSTASVPLALIEAAGMLGAKPSQLLLKVILPSAKPAIFNDLRIVLGWAWTYIVVAEIVAASSGVGYVILSASRFMDTATIFVGIIAIGCVGLVSDLVFNAAARRFFPYIQHARS